MHMKEYAYAIMNNIFFGERCWIMRIAEGLVLMNELGVCLVMSISVCGKQVNTMCCARNKLSS